MDAVTLAAANAAAGKKFVPRKAVTSLKPFGASTYGTFATAGYGKVEAVGYDDVDQVVFFTDQNGLYTRTYASTTLSTNKTYPYSGQTGGALQIQQIVRFKGNLYMQVTAVGSPNVQEVWQAAPQSGNTAYTWTRVLQCTPGSRTLFGNLVTDGNALLLGEYGDPVIAATKTPHIWRTTDGTTWTAAWTGSSGYRHVHNIAFDPYTANRVLATLGDGSTSVPNLLQSTDGGATWTGVTGFTNVYQSTQISFDATRVYLLSDDQDAGAFYALPRTNLDPTKVQVCSDNNFRYLGLGTDNGVHKYGQAISASTVFHDFWEQPFSSQDVGVGITGTGIPAGTTIASVQSASDITLSAAATVTTNPLTYRLNRIEQINSTPLSGIVDPATGFLYCITNANVIGGPNGRICLLYSKGVGYPMHVLEVVLGTTQYGSYYVPGIFIANGQLWYGPSTRPLLTAGQALT